MFIFHLSILFDEMSVYFFSPYYNQIVLLVKFQSPVYSLNIFVEYIFCNIVLQVHSLSLHPFNIRCFTDENFLFLIMSNLLIFTFIYYTLMSNLRTLCQAKTLEIFFYVPQTHKECSWDTYREDHTYW